MAVKIKRRPGRRKRRDASPNTPKGRQRPKGRIKRAFSRGQFDTFDPDIAQTLALRPGWPAHKQDILGILSYVERFMPLDDRIICFDPITSPPHPTHALPEQLVEVMTHMGSLTTTGQPIIDAISDEQARQLWDSFKDRADALSKMSEHQEFGDLDTLEPWALFEALTVLVAEGMTYTRGLSGRDLNFSVEAQAHWLQGLELFLASLIQVFTADLRSLWWLVRQPLKQGGFSGMCRHYSLILQAFYAIAARARQTPLQGQVLTISGTHQFLLQFDHAWTWFVDAPSGRIVPVDLTGADWLYDRKMADSIFNRGFDAHHFNNVSAFVQTALGSLGINPQPAPQAKVFALLTSLIRPQTTYGQALLLNLARHNTFPDDARARVLSLLREQPNLSPWLDELMTLPTSMPLRAARSSAQATGLHMALLDAIGLD